MKLTKDDLSSHMEELFGRLARVRSHGQSEYARSDDNAFRNFEWVASILGLTRDQVAAVYMLKHIDGICGWLCGNKNQRDSISGRIEDAIMYLIIIDGMIINEED